MHVEVLPHNPAWKSAFEREAARITDTLGDLVTAIHHIGSTAIAGMPAKPIIDVLLEVEDLGRLDRDTPRLEAMGYEAKGEFGIPGRRYFRKENARGARTHHVQAFEAGSSHVARHLAFRDYMIAHPEAAHTYGALKQRLALEHPDDSEAYTDGKDAYVKDQERRALAWSSGGGLC
jgi:GrpB-like predicted nucleotidyltransferase (UPF0157 family)